MNWATLSQSLSGVHLYNWDRFSLHIKFIIPGLQAPFESSNEARIMLPSIGFWCACIRYMLFLERRTPYVFIPLKGYTVLCLEHANCFSFYLSLVRYCDSLCLNVALHKIISMCNSALLSAASALVPQVPSILLIPLIFPHQETRSVVSDTCASVSTETQLNFMTFPSQKESCISRRWMSVSA